jgi:hypothetical protein
LNFNAPTADPAAELFRRVLLTDVPRFVVAIVSMAIGSGSILVQWLRRKSSERLRLWFGLIGKGGRPPQRCKRKSMPF